MYCKQNHSYVELLIVNKIIISHKKAATKKHWRHGVAFLEKYVNCVIKESKY